MVSTVDKISQGAMSLISTVSKELLVILILGAIMALYLFFGSIGKTKRAVSRKKNAIHERFMQENIEFLFRRLFGRVLGSNAECFEQGCKDYLEKNNLTLSKSSVKQMIKDNMKVLKNDAAIKNMYMSGKQADDLADGIYRALSFRMKQGPEYEKMTKTIRAEMEKKFKDMDFTEEGTKDTVADFKGDAAKDYIFDSMNDRMMQDMQMQNQMMIDMQIQMQNQMMMDMQMQMQNQMMMDMQMQMQNQMMMDMQMQMQNQMMNEMTMQMNNMAGDSMHMANMAITQTDFGGFMNNDSNSGSFL